MTQEELEQIAAVLLDTIDQKKGSANEIINTYTKTHRYIEGSDRRELLNLVWSTLRAKARLNYAYPNMDTLSKVRILQKNGIPDVLNAPDWVRFEVQEWFLDHIPDPQHELPPLLDQAPVVLRANGNREKIIEQLLSEGIKVHPCARSPLGLILDERCDLTETKAYKKGLIEIQDEGAQLLSLEIGVKPKDDVFDFCAGAGGKSLIFAQIMQNKGFIQAYDASFKRLSELSKRAYRAKATIIKPVFKLPETYKKFDHVVVDAPCSGTGTWRRSPDGRWSLTLKQLENIVSKQADILNVAEQYVKNGHFLSYITCSLTFDENERQIEHFIKHHPRYQIIKQMRFSPARTQTDGFFLCVMQKR